MHFAQQHWEHFRKNGDYKKKCEKDVKKRINIGPNVKTVTVGGLTTVVREREILCGCACALPSALVSSHYVALFEQQMIRRSQKAMCTTSIIVGMFIACWIPYCCLQMIGLIKQVYSIIPLSVLHVLNILDKTFYILLLFNGLIDPLVYSLRMRQIRLGTFQFPAPNHVSESSGLYGTI